MRGRGWHSYIRLGDEQARLSWDLLKRVLHYSSAYRWQLSGMLVLILAADQILVFNRGRIAEKGTHTELMAEGGIYANLYHTQFDRQTS